MDLETSGESGNENGLSEEEQRWGVGRQVTLSRAFSPAAPVTRADLFARRGDKMDYLMEAIMQPGQHAVIYGERGVGKTSFVSVVGEIYQGVLLNGRTNCASGDTFSTVWKHLFESIELVLEDPKPGFERPSVARVTSAGRLLAANGVTPDDVRRALTALSEVGSLVLFIDEFDRVTAEHTKRQFADAIKALSDYSVRATIVLVGVGDSVSDLISAHESINRALVQLHMPRMTEGELSEILDRCFKVAAMTIEDDARARITRLSRGLPHYTHLLALHSAKRAIEERRENVIQEDVEGATKTAVARAQEYIAALHSKATWSTRETNYEQVLLACALAPVDERGYFAPADLRAPLSRIMGRRYEIPNFIQNLNQLASESRGGVLEKMGEPRAYRYRFRDPLLQPYVVLKGVETGMIKQDDI